MSEIKDDLTRLDLSTLAWALAGYLQQIHDGVTPVVRSNAQGRIDAIDAEFARRERERSDHAAAIDAKDKVIERLEGLYREAMHDLRLQFNECYPREPIAVADWFAKIEENLKHAKEHHIA